MAILILGAGIIGLQTATTLLEAGYAVTIVAECFPGTQDTGAGGLYASPWAGAQWRTHARSDDAEQAGWDIETYKQWMDEAKGGKGKGKGLAIMPSHLYWPSPAPSTAIDTWWSRHVIAFQPLPTSSLPSNTPIASGVSFTSITIDVPTHLSSLLSSVESAGGKLIRTALSTENGLPAAVKYASELIGQEFYAIVNATGLGARELVPDSNLYPTRGQTVVVKGEAEKISTFEGIGTVRYVIPRKGSGTSLLGGTKQAGNWNTELDEQTTREILEGCKVLAPELLTDGEFQVLKAQVGLRPSREGGARVESEIVEAEKGGRWRVVHAYGHSGGGYQNSIGVARKVLRLVKGFEGRDGTAAKL